MPRRNLCSARFTATAMVFAERHAGSRVVPAGGEPGLCSGALRARLFVLGRAGGAAGLLAGLFWYELALAEGDQNSKSLLEGLSTQLTREQVANIRQQAEAWLHAHNQTAKSTPN